MKTKFFLCRHCGNVVYKIVDSGVVPICCGEPMTELIPNTQEEACQEKHLPVAVKMDGCNYRVKIGGSPHPMQPEHHIRFVFLETEDGGQLVNLKDRPEAHFCTCKTKPTAVYAYCNIHGLWRVKM